MSVVAGFSFPEEAVIISDSRISFSRNKVIVKAEDNLRKIFALTPELAVGFVTNDVNLTYRILSKLQDYIKKEAKVKIVYHLLQKLPKVAEYEYKKLSRNMRTPPEMEFIYAGILSDRSIEFPESAIMKLMSHGGAVPEPFGRALMTMQNGMMTMDPPTPVIMVHRLPTGEVSNLGVYNFACIGSGASIEKVFTKEYSMLLTCEPAPVTGFRSNMIRLLCDDFIKESGIPTIGGAIQALRISTKGVIGVTSSFKRIFSDSSVRDISSMDFDGEKWTWRDYENGTVETIKSYLPSVGNGAITYGVPQESA